MAKTSAAKPAPPDATVAKGAVVNLLGYVAGLLDPLFLIVVSRLLGPGSLGKYILATTYIAMIMRFVVMGLDKGLLRHVALARGGENPREVELRVLGTALRWSTGLSLLGAAGVYLLADWIVRSGGDDPSGQGALWLSVLILAAPAQAVSAFFLFALRAVSNMVAFVVVRNVGTNALLFAIAVPLIALDVGERSLMVAYLAAHYATAVAAWIWFSRSYPHVRWSAMLRAPRDRALLSFSFPQGLTEFLNLLLTRSDIIMIGLFFPDRPELVAVYAVASLLSGVVKKIRQSFDTSLAPVLSQLIADHDVASLKHTYARVARWIYTLYLLLGGVLALGAPVILQAFGSDYPRFWLVVPILVAGHLVNAAGGPAQTALLMAGRSKLELLNNVLINVFNIGLNVLMIPRYGVYGAAIATAIAFSVFNLLRVIEVRSILTISAHPGTVARTSLAALLSGGLAASLLLVDTSLPWIFTAAVALFILAYPAALYAVGQRDEARSLLRGLQRRFTGRRKLART